MRRPVVVVGAGPVGLAAAIDLGLRGIPVVLIDDADRIGEGSRGICWSKRTLEIFDRLGVGEQLVAQGVTWKLGKLFRGDDLVFSFDLQPEDGPQDAGLHQPAAVLCREARWSSAPTRSRRSRSAGRTG